jgi:hypothetical protein
MKTTMHATPTTAINGIPVDDLPTPIRNEIATFDRVRQEYIDAAYKLEVLHHALESMRSNIAKMVGEELSSKRDQESAE